MIDVRMAEPLFALASRPGVSIRLGVEPQVPKLAPGERVVITGGPFMHFQATVVDRLGLDAARVLIDIFGGQTPAEIGVADLANP